MQQTDQRERLESLLRQRAVSSSLEAVVAQQGDMGARQAASRAAICRPPRCRWTQWIFLQLFNKGLAYQAEVPVNWCPALGTGAASVGRARVRVPV